MGPRRIRPDPLEDHTIASPVVSYQVGTSTGATTTGRAHTTFSSSLFDATEDEEDVDMELPDLLEVDVEDSDNDKGTGAALPPVKVITHKVPAKRYTNSVSAGCYSIDVQMLKPNRMIHWRRGFHTGKSIWRN